MTEKLLTDVEYNYKFIDERIAEAAEKSGYYISCRNKNG